MNSMLLKFALCLLVNIHALFLFAQDPFSGKVQTTTAIPVPNATVQVLNSNIAVITGRDGVFSIPNLRPGRYEFHIRSIGYAPVNQEVTVTTGASQPVLFVLTDEAVRLPGVVVSAQKKEEFEHQVPLSITALASKQVADLRLWNNDDLTAVVPGLHASNSGDERNVTSIRGIVTTSYDPAVTTYVDGVNQFSLDTYLANLWDVERIEVLRGPQGTLYGRNAMAGVVNIITKQPGNRISGFAEVNAGNFGLERYSAGIRIPVLKDKLFFGASGLYSRRDGYYDNKFNNISFDKQRTGAGNYYLKFLPNNKWTFTLNAKHQSVRNNGAFPMAGSEQDAFDEPFVLNQDATAIMKDKILNASLSADRQGKRFNFSSQTAYQTNYRYYDKPLDGDFSPIDGVTIINNYGGEWNKVKVATQEFKFTSPTVSASKLKWIAGAYLFYQDNPVKQATRFGNDALLVGAPDVNFSIINTTKANTKGIAGFGQVTYALTDRLEIVAGLRYDYEEKDYSIRGEYQKDPDPTPLFETRSDTSASVDFHALSPKLGLIYAINERSTAFVTYSRGYRTGGLTALSSDPSQPPLFPYEPEYSNNIEVGLKNNLWNNKLQVNVYGFLTYVNDAQVPTLQLPDAVTIVKNAGKLTSKGVELEANAALVRGLELSYRFGYTDAEYTNLKLAQNGAAVDLKGKKQVFTPEVTSMLAVQYSQPLSAKKNIRMIVRGEWKYLGRRYFDLANTISQHDHSLLNGRLGISTRRLGLFFWARNIFDETYIAYAYDFGAVHLGDPRTYGVTLSAGF